MIARDPITGKIYACGQIFQYTNAGVWGLLRLQTNGIADATFLTVSTGAPSPNRIIPKAANMVMVAGNGPLRRHNSNGTLDASFAAGSFSGGIAYALIEQPDGKFLVAGSFTTYNGATRNRLARLNADGTLDATFDPGLGPNNAVTAMALEPDGSILIGGDFTSYAGTVRNRLARINADGSLDDELDPGAGPSGNVSSIISLPDTSILIGGSFTSYNGVPTGRIARIIGHVPTPPPPPPPPFSAAVKAYLEGPLAAGGLMSDALRALPSFPLVEPFSTMGYSTVAYPTSASINANVLAVTGNNAIVDWMLIELRSSAAPGTVMASRPALLQRDGDVVDLDGTSNVSFPGMAGGSYCIALRPRNHLPIMLAPSSAITGNGSGTTVDFTLGSTPLWDNDARTTILGALVLAAGDINFNGTVQYTGSGNDRDPILTRVGSTTPANTVSGYWREDVNMDGVVKYTGANNDRDPILVNVGSTTPNNTRVAPLP